MKTKVDRQKIRGILCGRSLTKLLNQGQLRQPCNEALVVSHIVWLISKLYLLLFGSDSVFIFFKKAVFGNTNPKSRDRSLKTTPQK